MRRIRFTTGAMVIFAAHSAMATPGQSDLCLRAAQMAADETGVPYDVLLAVSLTETGRAQKGGALQPWPWASNQGGEGHWFGSLQEAVDHVDTQIAAGVTNIDLGCFQLNHRWHSENFASTEAMFDPVENARYAARLLAKHFKTLGDWSLAAGAYHSGTPEFAERYRSKFDKIYHGVTGTAPDLQMAAVAPPEASENTFPLLLAGSRATGPSLFPTLTPGRRLIGE